MDRLATAESIYTDGSYLDRTRGTWHLEDSPFKARQVARMLQHHPEIRLGTLCEIGCGAGGILAELQKLLPAEINLTGYEISPQAHAISARFANPRCRFILADAFADPSTFDLAMAMDVVEHVEDCFSFLRQMRSKARWKLYHIPLDTHASALLRGLNQWDSMGHLHLFTMETALQSLRHTGHKILDWTLTDAALEKAEKALRTRLANLARRPMATISKKFTARLLGGYSMLILAE